MWMEVTNPGTERTNGRKLEERPLVTIVTYWSRFFFHSAIVPPFARYLRRGSSASRRSSEWSEQEYSPLNRFIAWGRSDWYSKGSLRNTKSGGFCPNRCRREDFEFWNPSIFHDRQLKDCFLNGEASNLEFDLSGISLNWLRKGF